ncbi:hypothetical protein EI94DRAFT_1776338 [Lactarius quietus]|nr:hypothetical protein EI94DRAFT_1776338 [Lactarius quietus]
MPIALFGLLAGGVRSTLANGAYTPADLAFQYTNSRVRVVFSHPDLVPVVLQASAWARKFWILELEDLLGHRTLPEETFAGSQADETPLQCYSSDTTGKPKGTTHRDITSGLSMAVAVQMRLFPPLSYPFYCGFPVVVLPKFDPEQFCRSIERYRVTVTFVVPPIILVLVHHPATSKYNLRSLKLMVSGAAALSAGVVDLGRNKFSSVGATVDIIQGFGLTETSPVTHLLPPKDGLRKLWFHGPTVMKGYLNNPSAPANLITVDGWLKTGDIMTRGEDGYYNIVDQKKELIKYKASLDSTLLRHPDIVDAAVIGVEDAAQATELPHAYVVHKTGSASLPNAAGKILLREQRERAKSDL